MSDASTNTALIANRRDMLLGSVLVGASALAGARANAGPVRHSPQMRPSTTSPILIQDKQLTSPTPADLTGYERVKQVLVAPPFAPDHEMVASGAPKIVEIELVVDERLMEVDEFTGASIWALTFNGSVPAPLIIVHEGDYVELTLINPETSNMEHNIDFHASSGAMGGGALTSVFPGEQTVLRWKATVAGCFTYHCAPGGAMIHYHVCHGMNGAVMVLPRDGLKSRDGTALPYDKIAYIGEQDFYLPKDENGDYRTYESAGEDTADSMEAMTTLVPTHVVFNGSIDALTGDNAITAEVGTRMLIIHNQCNRDSRPHLIGGHGDYVWEGAFTDPPQTNMETWFVRGGSAVAAYHTFLQPGLYAYVNHNLIEGILLGATAHFQVTGEWNNALMEQVSAAGPIEI